MKSGWRYLTALQSKLSPKLIYLPERLESHEYSRLRYILSSPQRLLQKSGGTIYFEVATMSWKAKLVLGVLTAMAMSALTLTLPKANSIQSAQVVLFPLTVGVWAIFVLLFVKLK